MVTFTFIRHGESTDNLRHIWAGWKDAPLSNHGMNQARALGTSLADTHFTAIHSSDLKRALTTAQEVQSSQPEPKPPLIASSLLREQHFGIAEGKPWCSEMETGVSLAQHIAKGVFPTLHGRTEKYPEGECTDDLARRAEQAIEEIVMPYVWQAAKEGLIEMHVAIVSHGLSISEIVAALVRKDAGEGTGIRHYRGLMNTAWTRVNIEVKNVKEGELQLPDNDPPLVVRVIDFNSHQHLEKIVRQKGGTGSAAHDPKQKDIRAFFSGDMLEELK